MKIKKIVTAAIAALCLIGCSAAKDDKMTAQEGDTVTVSYVLKVDGEVHEENDNFEVTLGSGETLEEFEQALYGVKEGDDVVAEFVFPEDYWSEDIAGKQAHFDIHVDSVYRYVPLAESGTLEEGVNTLLGHGGFSEEMLTMTLVDEGFAEEDVAEYLKTHEIDYPAQAMFIVKDCQEYGFSEETIKSILTNYMFSDDVIEALEPEFAKIDWADQAKKAADYYLDYDVGRNSVMESIKADGFREDEIKAVEEYLDSFDWNERALKAVKSYVEDNNVEYTEEYAREFLSGNEFTEEQITYAIDHYSE